MTRTYSSAYNSLAVAYHAHHFHCPQCIAAGQWRGTRCATGAKLWATYQGAA